MKQATGASMTEQAEPERVNLELAWREVPSVFFDQIIGYTASDNIGRVSFGEIAFRPNSQTPIGRPVVTMIGGRDAWVRVHEQIGEIIRNMDESAATLGSPEAIEPRG
jgi:hypothetical protein